MKFHVVMASHNRCATTLKAIGSLTAAADFAGTELAITLYDDASSDNTRSLVKTRFPDVGLIEGSGSAFWAQAMHQAEHRVLGQILPAGSASNDYIVWYNDDVILDHDALVRIAAVTKSHRDSIVVCAVRDPTTHLTTYSGFTRLGHHPLRLGLVEPGTAVQSLDTFNGNLVFVPIDVARALSGIDGSYAHALADIDYGYRANKAGYSVLLAPGTYGTCPRNPIKKWSGAVNEWRSFTGVKGGGHAPSLRKILRLGAPRTYPFYFGATYAIWWLRALRRSLIRK